METNLDLIEYFGFFGLCVLACVGVMAVTWWLLNDQYEKNLQKNFGRFREVLVGSPAIY